MRRFLWLLLIGSTVLVGLASTRFDTTYATTEAIGADAGMNSEQWTVFARSWFSTGLLVGFTTTLIITVIVSLIVSYARRSRDRKS